MNSYNRYILPAIGIIVVIAVIWGGIYSSRGGEVVQTPTNNQPQKKVTYNPQVKKATPPAPLASGCGLTITAPENGAQAVFPLTITGKVNNVMAKTTGCGWTIFEGQAGTAQLYLSYINDTWIPVEGSSAVVKVVGDVGTTTSVKTVINFDNKKYGLPAKSKMRIVFYEEDAKGDGSGDRVNLDLMF